MKRQLECKKCGWRWKPKTEKKPRACPACKSYWWDGKPEFQSALNRIDRAER